MPAGRENNSYSETIEFGCLLRAATPQFLFWCARKHATAEHLPHTSHRLRVACACVVRGGSGEKKHEDVSGVCGVLGYCRAIVTH